MFSSFKVLKFFILSIKGSSELSSKGISRIVTVLCTQSKLCILYLRLRILLIVFSEVILSLGVISCLLCVYLTIKGKFLDNEPSKGIFYYNNGVKLVEGEVLIFENLLMNDTMYRDRYIIGNNIILFHDDGSLKFEGNLLRDKNVFNSRVKTDNIFINNIE